jgi:hypothetical protein
MRHYKCDLCGRHLDEHADFFILGVAEVISGVRGPFDPGRKHACFVCYRSGRIVNPTASVALTYPDPEPIRLANRPRADATAPTSHPPVRSRLPQPTGRERRPNMP